MLQLNSISYCYETKKVLSAINFSITKGEHIAIMGESGCGKSTLLKAIYGLLDLDSGEITYNNQQLLGPKFNLVPGHSFMKYLAQEFDLMPYTSAAQNVGQFLSNFYPKKKKKRIEELLEVVGMSDFAGIHVKKLSGGQKQRIALARVLAKQPEILLLDEPFSQIDNFKKNELRYSLFEFIKKEKITCITASHDKNDVMPFANEIVILKNGKQLLKDTPKEIYKNPKDFYSASLLSEINCISARYFSSESDNKKILLYPNEIRLSTKSNVTTTVIQSFYKGTHFVIKALLNNETILFNSKRNLKPKSVVGICVSEQILKKRLQK